MDYILHVAIFILIYAIIVQSLNLIIGYVGIISMAHAIFAAIGAYSAALISVHLGLNFVVGFIVGFIISAIIGALVALPSLRVRDEYLIVFTVGFQMVLYEFMLTARGITQGQGGIGGIESPVIFGVSIDSTLSYLVFTIVVATICFLLCWRLVNSPFGRVLKAIREDEAACRALGKNTLLFKVSVFAIGGGLAAIGGSLFAHYVTFISPFSFTIEASIFLIVMVVIGGSANFWGPLVGAGILIGLPELLNFIPGAAGAIDAIREMLFGLVLMACMLFRPQGILPEYSRNRLMIVSEPANREEGRQPDEESIQRESFLKEDSNPVTSKGIESEDRPILELKNVTKTFGGLKAVDDASIVLTEGKIIGLIGPNGCGKTTLFNLVTGFIEPDRGSIYLRGEDVTKVSPYKLVDKGLVRSWQDTKIFKGMTVLENVMVGFTKQPGEQLHNLYATYKQVKEEEANNRIVALDYLKKVELLDKKDLLAGDLSVAEQKLVALARLLATGCPILLLDEPTASLDLDSVNRIIKIIRDIAKAANKTVLLIEHNLDVVRGIVEKAYFMSEGKIIAYDAPLELMKNKKLSEVYFGIE